MAIDFIRNDLNCWPETNNLVLQNKTIKTSHVRRFSCLLQQLQGCEQSRKGLGVYYKVRGWENVSFVSFG
jgi:hypothetical protein